MDQTGVKPKKKQSETDRGGEAARLVLKATLLRTTEVPQLNPVGRHESMDTKSPRRDGPSSLSMKKTNLRLHSARTESFKGAVRKILKAEKLRRAASPLSLIRQFYDFFYDISDFCDF